MPTATPTKSEVMVAPFGIEADGRRNNVLLLMNIPGVQLRSRETANRPVIANPQSKDKEDRPIGRDFATFHGSMPEIPGQPLHLNPATRQWRVFDPLTEDENLCRRIARALVAGEHVVNRNVEIKGVPTQEGTLGPDEMKTLIREVCQLMQSNDARLIKGPRPYGTDKQTGEHDMTDVDELRWTVTQDGKSVEVGDYLLEPFATDTNRPRYEKDLASWVQRLNRIGD